MEFTGKDFKVIRNLLGFTQEKMAQELFVSTKTVSRYESGSYRIPMQIKMVCDAMMERNEAEKSSIRSMNHMEFYRPEVISNSYDRVIFVDVECVGSHGYIGIFAIGIDEKADGITACNHQAGDTIDTLGVYSWPEEYVDIDRIIGAEDSLIVSDALKHVFPDVDKSCVIRGMDGDFHFLVKKSFTPAKNSLN